VAKETGSFSWKELALGMAILEAGNACQLKTGDWRSAYPITDTSLCIKCGQCYLFCPDATYSKTEEGYYMQDYYFCKGCGICARECPAKAIKMVQEGD
jgi:pyruvate ferredoxin oxidoreductase delta subunit